MSTASRLAFAWIALLFQLTDGQLPTRFRSVTTEVVVNVAVLRGNNPVNGLTTQDFEVTDNGVVQSLRAVEIEDVPLDITLVIDTSGSTERLGKYLSAQANEVMERLVPADRLRLLTIDTFVREIRPMQAPGAIPLDIDVPIRGSSSVFDALAVSLMSPVTLGRRHLVAVMTDGIETMSSVSAHHVREVALRTESVLHVLLVRTASGAPSRFPPWLPYREFDEALLRDAAAATGGQHHDLRESYSPAYTFRRVIDEFRRSYILRYTPEGVSSEGWHDLAVKIRKPNNFTIRARRGYFGTNP